MCSLKKIMKKHSCTAFYSLKIFRILQKVLRWIAEYIYCAATPIASFVQCHISFRPLPLSVPTFVFIEIFLKQSHKCSGMR